MQSFVNHKLAEKLSATIHNTTLMTIMLLMGTKLVATTAIDLHILIDSVIYK